MEAECHSISPLMVLDQTWVHCGLVGNFEREIFLPEEWRDNFRMSRSSPLSLSELLRPYIEGETTIMQSPVCVVKKVACTMYYLGDEGRLHKTANAFGLSLQVVSKIVRQLCKAITEH
ncbi:hypothetical protein AMECASPLE_025369 [Ameca splendens]|uniref:Uncharacterized protein n=1 Tax=Ameca splendens TaxID=208324 RepID=A0ABV0Z2M4_9TELE